MDGRTEEPIYLPSGGLSTLDELRLQSDIINADMGETITTLSPKLRAAIHTPVVAMAPEPSILADLLQMSASYMQVHGFDERSPSFVFIPPKFAAVPNYVCTLRTLYSPSVYKVLLPCDVNPRAVADFFAGTDAANIVFVGAYSLLRTDDKKRFADRYSPLANGIGRAKAHNGKDIVAVLASLDAATAYVAHGLCMAALPLSRLCALHVGRKNSVAYLQNTDVDVSLVWLFDAIISSGEGYSTMDGVMRLAVQIPRGTSQRVSVANIFSLIKAL